MDELPTYYDPLYLRALVLDIYDGTPGRRVRYMPNALWKLRSHNLVEMEVDIDVTGTLVSVPIPSLTAAGVWLAERFG